MLDSLGNHPRARRKIKRWQTGNELKNWKIIFFSYSISRLPAFYFSSKNDQKWKMIKNGKWFKNWGNKKIQMKRSKKKVVRYARILTKYTSSYVSPKTEKTLHTEITKTGNEWNEYGKWPKTRNDLKIGKSLKIGKKIELERLTEKNFARVSFYPF